MIKIICSICNEDLDRKGRYCKSCHATYMRKYRETHKMSKEQRFKDNLRRKTRMKVQRGSLIKFPCNVCDDKKSEIHHKNYDDPNDIVWLCRKHHLELHRSEQHG